PAPAVPGRKGRGIYRGKEGAVPVLPFRYLKFSRWKSWNIGGELIFLFASSAVRPAVRGFAYHGLASRLWNGKTTTGRVIRPAFHALYSWQSKLSLPVRMVPH